MGGKYSHNLSLQRDFYISVIGHIRQGLRWLLQQLRKRVRKRGKADGVAEPLFFGRCLRLD